MKKFKSIVAASLAAAMIVGSLAACTNNSGSNPTPSQGDKQTDAPAPVETDAPAEKTGVFSYFGPAWMIDFSMHADEAGSVGNNGGWRITEGPQGFFWGGTWICAANGTDNADLVANIIKVMTTDDEILSKIIEEKNDFVNDATLIDKYATDEAFGDKILGGQNGLAVFSKGVSTVDLSNISNYDQGCNEAFQQAMKDYFYGKKSYDEAVEDFYKAVIETYPSLVAPADKDNAKADDASNYEYAAKTSNDGTVLNIRVWNEEWITRFNDYFPGYTPADEKDVFAGGTLDFNGETIKVVVSQVENKNNAYQDALDAALEGQFDADEEDIVDIFLVEADYALKYVNSNKTLALADLGLSDADFADQYKYTQDTVTDAAGRVKGSSWQGCPGALIYRADIAKEVLGSDDPADVQAAVADWAKFEETAAKMKDAGYNMTATVNDTFRVFSNNVSSKWVVDGVINIDENIKAWAEMSKKMFDAGQTANDDLWGDVWTAGFYY